jgi:hypothetical protein
VQIPVIINPGKKATEENGKSQAKNKGRYRYRHKRNVEKNFLLPLDKPFLFFYIYPSL